MKTESTKRNGQFWKNVMIGGIPGICIGSVGTVFAKSLSADTPVKPVNPVDPVDPELEPLPVAEVDDEMSFGEAFAEARDQVGPGGIFEWRGNVYNTYKADEWEAMSDEDRMEYADRLSMTSVEVTASEENPGSQEGEQTAGGDVITAEEDADNDVVGESDIRVDEVGIVAMEDGSEVVMAVGESDGHAALMADMDNDGVIDAIAVDRNDNGEIEENEIAPVEGEGLTVEDVVLLAENNLAEDPTDDIYPDTPDYMNDADISAYA